LREMLKCLTDLWYHVEFMNNFFPLYVLPADMRTFGFWTTDTVRLVSVKTYPLEQITESDKYFGM
jgi:hypothetical protein